MVKVLRNNPRPRYDMGVANTQETAREWLIGSELAERWQLPERTIEQWRYLGTGPPYHRFGRHVRYRRAD